MLKLGSSGPIVSQWQHTMLKRYTSYAKAANGGPLAVDGYYGYDDRDVQYEYERRTGQLVDGIVSDDDLRALGITAAPKPTPRHLAIVYRGTGGIIGEDIVSRVCQRASDVVEERNPEFPASMGGLPPGASGAPSAQKAIQIGLASGRREIQSGRTFILGGYSLGAIVASMLRAELEPGGPLAQYRDNYVAGFVFGNPARAFGHTYYLGAIPNGRGIADWHLPRECCTWDWCELAHGDDMYANVPLGDAGDIMTEIYQAVTAVELSDPRATLRAILLAIPDVLTKAGITIPLLTSVGGAALAGDPKAVAGVLLPVLGSTLTGMLQGGPATGPAAALQAAIIAIRFAAAGTAPHVNYHSWETLPGMTYLDLAVQHVKHWAATKAVR